MMLGSKTLEVGIGLVVVFLLVSIIATAAQEGIEALLKRRATDLERALTELLQGDTTALAAFYNHPLVSALYRGTYGETGAGGGTQARQKAELPSYIPRGVFSAAITNLLADGNPLADKQTYARLHQVRDALVALAPNDVAKGRKELEDWYDGAMDRASGWFKRRSQGHLFFIGLGSALLLNINAVTIAQYLNANDAQRQMVIDLGETLAPPPPAKPTPASSGQPTVTPTDKTAAKPADGTTSNQPDAARAEDTYAKLAEIGLPIGWSDATWGWMIPKRSDLVTDWVLLVAGWLITALAAMLGAPFWFDTLNRLMVIRSTVKPKEKSPDERSEDSAPHKTS